MWHHYFWHKRATLYWLGDTKLHFAHDIDEWAKASNWGRRLGVSKLHLWASHCAEKIGLVLVVEAVVDILVMEQKSVRRWNDTESNNETMTNGQMNEKLT